MPALAAVLALGAAQPASAWPGLNGRIGLTQDPRTKDVWAFARDGTSTQLTFTGNDEQQPSWAPDGKRIAFKRSDEVFIRDVTTDAPPLRLTFKASRDENNTQPAWTPDGTGIVYRTNRADPSQNVADTWIMNADGTGQRPLLVQPGDERYATLSPDGSRLAYTSTVTGEDSDLWVADLVTGERRLVFDSGRGDSAPAWSPDGTQLAFQSNGAEYGMDGDIFVLDLASGYVTQLTSDPPDAPVHDEGPAWSPDGTMIAFTSERADPLGDIWIMQADGSQPRRVTTASWLDESPDWQPIPFSVGTPRRPSVPCGDLSLAAGGVASVTAVKIPCWKALNVAARWTPATPGLKGFACVSTPHSFDQELVECEHRNERKGIAFVWRRPA